MKDHFGIYSIADLESEPGLFITNKEVVHYALMIFLTIEHFL